MSAELDARNEANTMQLLAEALAAPSPVAQEQRDRLTEELQRSAVYHDGQWWVPVDTVVDEVLDAGWVPGGAS